MAGGGLVNCTQKEVLKTERAILVELDEDGYYSSEPEAEETEWGSGDEGSSTSSELALGSEESCDSYERDLGGQDTRSEEEKICAKVREIQLWLDDSAEDLRNMLEVFRIAGGYFSVPANPCAFSMATLESLLKLAAKYNQPHIRKYAIKHLEVLSLDHIQRFRLARDYNISGWQAISIEHLCARDDPITEAEASILGFGMFSHIAAKRERLQHEKGRRMGVSQALRGASGKGAAPLKYHQRL